MDFFRLVCNTRKLLAHAPPPFLNDISFISFLLLLPEADTMYRATPLSSHKIGQYDQKLSLGWAEYITVLSSIINITQYAPANHLRERWKR